MLATMGASQDSWIAAIILMIVGMTVMMLLCDVYQVSHSKYESSDNTSLTLGAHAQEGYSTCFVCLSVCYHSSGGVVYFYDQTTV